ncbi:MAG: FAD:protein FMN transferase [Flavobacteriaceae bacterium]|nr:FAD:protein FMN transferase [Flavobacteriaceae bacterium]
MKVFALMIFFTLFQWTYAQAEYQRVLKLMGSVFDITVVADSKVEADEYIDLAVSEIERIEQLISSWKTDSQTSLINQNAGIKPVVVDRELYDLIERSIRISKLTDGAFDISYASMDNIWRYDGSMQHMPTKEAITASVAKVGHQHIILNPNENSVYLKLPGMKIGFGAIGKGYAADKAKALLLRKGIKNTIVNASGDLNAWGKRADGSEWKIAIKNPNDKQKIAAWLPVNDAAVVTSGNYEKFVVFNGQRYSHIIDPRTGYPVKGLKSVTIFAPSAELADALSTSVFVLGKEVGLDLINQLKGVECLIIDDENQITASEALKIYVSKNK